MSPQRTCRVGWAVVVLGGLLVACTRTPPVAPDTQRVVSLAPAMTAIITALGAADRLVGVTRHCDAPPGTPIVGDFTPVPEQVLAARPGLVLMAAYASQAADRANLEALGLPVTAVPLETLADLRAAIPRIADMLGIPQTSAALVSRLDAARDKLQRCLGDGPKPSWLVVYAVDGAHVYSTGGGDHIADLLALTSAPNALAGHARSARVGLEAILAARPDVILHVAPAPDIPDDAAARRWWATWDAIPAVRRGAVSVWPDDRLARNGPHLADLADVLCNKLRAGLAP